MFPNMADVENIFLNFTWWHRVREQISVQCGENCVCHPVKERHSTHSIEGYVLNLVQLMSDPNHIDDFKVHCRLSRELYIVIQNEVRHGHWPQATVLPDKQLLVALWYLVNKTSMKEVALLWFINCNDTRDNKRCL